MSELAIRDHRAPTPTTLTNEQLKFIASTEFVPVGLRGNLPAILACVATGRELGIGDMISLRSIHIIDGKPTMSAELMVQLVRKRGHSITGEVSDGSATVVGTRADNGDAMTVTWTTDMAARAGLLGKGNWKKYPEAMLWARAASQLCRMLFADCFAGATYTTEELGAEDTMGNGAPFVDAAADTPFAIDAVPFEASTGDPMAAQQPHTDAVVVPQAEQRVEPASPVDEKDWRPQLNYLVGTLRTAGHITTEALWKAMRPEDEGNWPVDIDGGLHWSDLRETLTVEEAATLTARLRKLEQKIAKAANA